MSALGDSRQRRRLAGELKRLRLGAGLTGGQVAESLGVSQPTISRIERGEQRVSIAQVALWSRATSAPPAREAELLELAGDILAGPRDWADETGSTDAQMEMAELEARTGTRSEFEPAVVPGLLQTSAYTARVMSSGPQGILPDLADRVMHRARRQRILDDESKRFRFVIPETVLRWPFGPTGDPAVVAEHREQLARVEAILVGQPNVMIGILPLAPSPAWRMTGFSIYDDVADGDPQVHVEWLTKPINILEPDQVEMCRQAFANLMTEAVTGDEARRLLMEAAARLQG